MKVEAVVEQGDTALGVAGPGVGRHQGGGRRRVLVPAPRRLRQGEQRTFQRIGEAAEGKLARQRQPGLELAERRRLKAAAAAAVPRSAERRVGKGVVRTCRYRWRPDPSTKKITSNNTTIRYL